MSQNRLKHNYRAQALLVVMLIMVAGSVVGLAMHSRTLKIKERAIQEKRSEEAMEYVESIDNMVSQLTITELIEKLEAESCWVNNGKCVFINDEIIDFLGTGLELESFNASNTNSEVKLSFAEAISKTDEYIVRKNKVKALPVSQVDSDCVYDFHFVEGYAAIVNLVYVQRNAGDKIVKIKPYEHGDITSECFADCQSSGDYGSGWKDGVDEFSGEVSLNSVTYDGDTYELYEIRVRAIGGPLTFYVEEEDEGSCQNPLEIRVVSSANNSGNYQSNYYVLPINNAAPPIMDYVLFNGEGTLEYIE